MDFIMNLMNAKIDIAEPNSSAQVNLLRQRHEYILFFILAYLWDKHSEVMDFGEFSKIIEDLSNKASIGKIVETIRKMDEDREIFINPKASNALNEYPNLRNDKHGHGYLTTEEEINGFVEKMEGFYRDLVDNIPLFIDTSSIILVKGKKGEDMYGIRFDMEKNGMPEKWNCPEEVFKCPEPYIGRTYAKLKSGEYIKLSPFIHLDNDGEDRYIFVSLREKLTGKVDYAHLLKGGNTKSKEWEELVSIFVVQNKYRSISSNGTIMNVFENNYKKYVSITNDNETSLRNFLLRDKSSVFCTLWGHGGVGKTALIQHVASDYFNQQRKVFDYIVFTSAKDRKYNPRTGKLEKIQDHIRSFEEVIFAISSTLNDLNLEYEQFLEQIDEHIKFIVEHQSKSLIIIDDFETFNQDERKKLTSFIHQLNLNYHKVVITTRVKHSVMGLEIPTSEFDERKSKEFLLKVTEAEYPSQYKPLSEVTNDQAKMRAIYEATAGRPIFLYQFLYLYVQHGFQESDFDKLARSESANIFLYEKIYDYLGERAKNLFVYLSQIINKDDLSFNATILEYIAARLEGTNDISEEMEELSNMRIIMSDSLNIYRAYSEEIVKIMNEYFLRRGDDLRKKVAQVIQLIGETKLDGDIYQSLLRNADESRKSESEDDVTGHYRELLNDPRCPMDIKQQAIRNVTSHFKSGLNKPDQAVALFKEFYNLFKYDQEIIRLYTMLQWNSDRSKACTILAEYFSKRKKSEPESLTLFFIWVEYQGKLILGRRREEIDSAQDNMEEIDKIRDKYKTQLANYMNEFGLTLYQILKKQPNAAIMDSDLNAHHLTNAVVTVVKSGTELIILQHEHLTRTEMTVELIQYGLKYLQKRSHKTLKSCQENIEAAKGGTLNEVVRYLKETNFQRFQRLNKPGDVIDFQITGVQPYGVFGRNDYCGGLLHKSNIPSPYNYNLAKYFAKDQVIRIEINSINPEKENFTAKFVAFQVEAEEINRVQ